MIIQVSRYQNVSILDFIGAQGDGGGGDIWSYKTCSSANLQSNHHHQQTNSVTALKGSLYQYLSNED